MKIDYDRSTPETEAFMLQIDDTEIDLTQVESKLHDMECEREAARDALQFVLKYAVFGLGIVHQMRPASPWDIVRNALPEKKD